MEPSTDQTPRPESIRWWILAPAIVLVLILLGILVRGNRDQKGTGESDRAVPGDRILSEISGVKGAGDGVPRLFDAGDSSVRLFLEANPDNPAAVLAIAALLHDKEFLHAYKNQFRDNPVFALHYLSKFPNDPEFDEWIQVVLDKEPDNALGPYLRITHLLKCGGATDEEIGELLADTSALNSYQDHSMEIEDKAREFLTDHLDLAPLDAARKSTSEYYFDVSLSYANTLETFVKGTIDAANPSADDLKLAAAIYNLGTNLPTTGDPAAVVVGLSMEMIYYKVLENGNALTFNIPPEEVQRQSAEEMVVIRRMIAAGAEGIDYLTEANYEAYLTIRRNEGPVAAFLFVEGQRTGGGG